MRADFSLFSFALAAGVSAGVAYAIIKTGWNWAMDLPGARSLHTRPVPRTGGLGLGAAVAASAGFSSVAGGEWPWFETMLAAALCAVSLIDDKRGLPVALRLSAHTGAALLYVFFTLASGRGLNASLPLWVWLPMAVLTIVAMSNFYNFMDGANGIAGGMALIGFGAFAVASAAALPALAVLCCALAGAALGFLVFNWPGRIFMGDCGAVPLGFLAASIGLSGWLAGAWTFWFPALVFAPFIVDASVTLVRRLLRGDRVWQPHREHYYQRVVRLGVSHGRLALGEYVLMLACATAALTLPKLGAMAQTMIFATIGLLFVLVMLLIDVRWRHHSAKQSA